MSNNVIILGAGASVGAGVPLLADFVDVMWTLAKTGRHNGQRIHDVDRDLLSEALTVRAELDNCHGRVALNLWNIEEMLSVLSFNAMTGGKKEQSKLDLVTRAIAKTIELTCIVTHDGSLDQRQSRMPKLQSQYVELWHGLLEWALRNGTELPTIITFNYDLVLERSLLSALIGKYYTGQRSLARSGVMLDYHTNLFAPARMRMARKEVFEPDQQYPSRVNKVEICVLEESEERDVLPINLLKLHGSANFPKTKRVLEHKSLPLGQRLTSALEDPLILPPVFNKANDSVGISAWTFALNALRKCKNLIVCGYSLPETDIYMQYFLKAGLGPNQDLNRVFVFDPVLFEDPQTIKGQALKKRYSAIFSDPLQARLDYQPATFGSPSNKGTLQHLRWLIQNHPEKILFG